MHFTVLVVGDDLRAALAPFCDHPEVAPYLRECFCRRRDGFTFVDEAHPKCRFCKGTGMAESTMSPAGRWDNFIVTHGQLVLKPGRHALPGSEQGDRDQARKGDVDFARMLAASWATYAVLANGVWSQPDDWCWFPGVARLAPHVVFVREDWMAHLTRAIEAIPEDAIVSVVNCHG